MSKYITEAFRQFTLLEDSETFALTPDGIDNLNSFMDTAMNDDDLEAQVIDPEAEDEDELKQSYIGKIICDCNICHSHVFFNKEDIVIEDDGVVNIDDECPYCMSNDGYTIIGEIKPWVETAEEIIEEPSEEEVDEVSEEELADEPIEIEAEEETEVVEESLQQESLNEDIQDVQVTTDDETMTMTTKEDGGVVIETSPVEEEEITSEEIDAELEPEFNPEEIEGFSDEMIAPISDETEQEILSNESEEAPEEEIEAEVTDELPPEEEIGEEIPEEATSEEDVTVDEFDEESFDELGEAYLRKNYDNVSGFKTTQVRVNENLLNVDGVITFKSGNQKKTNFVFESTALKNGKFLFEGYNTQITGKNKAFKLNCSIQNKVIIPESLKYNYTTTNALNESVMIKGTAKTIKRG